MILDIFCEWKSKWLPKILNFSLPYTCKYGMCIHVCMLGEQIIYHRFLFQKAKENSEKDREDS